MRILGLIPARGGSKGVPGKNIKILGGKSLLSYTAEAALESRLLSKVALSTDDVGIAAEGKRLGIDLPFLRPDDLAGDKTPTLPVINHALAYYAEQGDEFDAVCLLQPTSPFRPSGFIDRAISKFIELDADSLVSVLEVPDHLNPHWTFLPNENGFLQIATGDIELITRRQELPVAYFRDGSLYLTKSSILRSGSLYGKSLSYLVNDPNYYVNIDTLDDWERAEKWVENIGDF
ncbi:N-acylneuraminate cytidylyltransferase [Algoriphagus locisalis]|uniref:N-acylneuraminate cytidylyltransferase n=1 Tax=Algoriphagus locisalis TaxID=305507 RepID=A0A1I6XRF2_9BACT|nr:acylneuraminate cytidylyltransferase family protein [Algoriphagus locisalis]SFT40717.1 N-acylneuraminate cytidylyltransferase [Algoriphagus locisalis]